MNQEEFLRRTLNKIAKEFGYDVASTLELMFMTKEKELDQYKNILEDIDKYIHGFKIENIGEKTMLILNDILLIKNGLGKDVIRLNKTKELEEDK